MTQQIRISQIRQDGALAGQAIVWNPATSRWEPGTVAAAGSGGGGVPSGILDSAVVNPNPGGATYTSATVIGKIVDAANLKVTFTAPANGKALIRVNSRLGCSTTNVQNYFFVTTDSVTSPAVPFQTIYGYHTASGLSAATPSPYVDEFPLTGLTPGQVYTFYLAWSQSSTATWTIYNGQSGYGATVMTVETVGISGGGSGGIVAAAAPSQIIRSTGNFTLTTAYADLTAQEIVITGVLVGDVHEIGVSGLYGSEANHGTLDAVTYVGGVIQHWLSGATSEDSVNGNGGVNAWFGAGGVFTPIGGSLHYTIQASDISAGTVTWRLRGKGLSRTLFAVAAHPFQWWVRASRSGVTVSSYYGKFSGTLVAAPGTTRFYNGTGHDLTIISVWLSAETGPVGADIIADVNQNGTTIFTNQANRPRVLAGATAGSTSTVDAPTWHAGSYLIVDLDQVGSPGTEGKDLTVQIEAT